MNNAASRFYNSITDVSVIAPRELVGFFIYFLTIEFGEEAATPLALRQCYSDCELTPPARLSAYLSEGLSSKPQLYIKAPSGGYRLQRHFREEVSAKLGAQKVTAQTSAELRKLEATLFPGAKKVFLSETIDCFEAGANRAAIVMCWILAVDHLFDHVLNHHLPAFNAALAKNPDKRVRVAQTKDDLRELSESKLIELLRAANIISNDVRKILEEKLGTRNSCAHPSGVTIKNSKVIDFIDDLVVNVIDTLAT